MQVQTTSQIVEDNIGGMRRACLTKIVKWYFALADGMHSLLQDVTKRDWKNLPWRLCQRAGVSAPFLEICQFVKLMKRAFYRAFEHDAFGIAKAAAYSLILTLFPALLVLGSVLATTPRFQLYVAEISEALGRILPTGSATAAAYLRNTQDRPVNFLIATSLLTVWTASSAIISWMEGFRKSYQLPQTWGVVKERLIASSLVILAGVPMSFATVLIAFGSQIEHRVLPHMGHGLEPLILLLGTGLRWLVASLTSIAVIALIYHNAIPRTRRWHTVLPGAIVATGLWFVATWLFGWYLRQSSEYSVIYGFFGVGIALLVWMYVVSLIVLVGAELNAILFPRTAPPRKAPKEIQHGKAAAA